jgi:hypothetical protein
MAMRTRGRTSLVFLIRFPLEILRIGVRHAIKIRRYYLLQQLVFRQWDRMQWRKQLRTIACTTRITQTVPPLQLPVGGPVIHLEVLPPPPSTAKKNRGGHKGRTATKANLVAEEHCRKKLKTLSELTIIQKERQETNARFQQFQMLKWQFEMELDPVSKESLSAAMGAILTEAKCVPEEPTVYQPEPDEDDEE